MPYIVQEWRDRLAPHIKALTGEFEKLPEEMVSTYFRSMLTIVIYEAFGIDGCDPCDHSVEVKSSELGKFLREMPEFEENRGGILNYTFTMIAIYFVGSPRYSKVNRLIGMCARREIRFEVNKNMLSLDGDQLDDIVGALRCMQLEFYHKLIRPYEDKKTEENGDVF
jgi:hypothetical protein